MFLIVLVALLSLREYKTKERLKNYRLIERINFDFQEWKNKEEIIFDNFSFYFHCHR